RRLAENPREALPDAPRAVLRAYARQGPSTGQAPWLRRGDSRPETARRRAARGRAEPRYTDRVPRPIARRCPHRLLTKAPRAPELLQPPHACGEALLNFCNHQHKIDKALAGKALRAATGGARNQNRPLNIFRHRRGGRLSPGKRRVLQAAKPRSRKAAPYDRGSSVSSVVGAKPSFLTSLRISRMAAFLSRRRWTRRSRTSPSSSTAGHRYMGLPPIRTTTRRGATTLSTWRGYGGADVHRQGQTSQPTAARSRS
ncbi:MAG: hypothetical protein JWM38_1582, partial [Sphingomonas bacterium]|nr:hypothetical protein [Sphingomonas bacterium]